MKRFLIILTFLTLQTLLVYSAEKKHYHYKFNEHSYTITKGQGDSLHVSSMKEIADYGKAGNPALPIHLRNVALEVGQSITDFNFTTSKRLIMSDVDIAPATHPIPTNALPMPTPRGEYKDALYPEQNVKITRQHTIGGYNLVTFAIVPYVYDAKSRSLYFIDEVNIELNIKEGATFDKYTKTSPQQMSLIRGLVGIGGIDTTNIIPEIINPFEYDAGDYQYVIITNNALKNAFQPLADWKRTKGLRSKVVTIESICQFYSGATTQIKIKSFITDYYNNHNTQYVLLGGDNNIVPTQNCYVGRYDYFDPIMNQTIIDSILPADVYYADLSILDWDIDHDGLVGERSEIDYPFPWIYVSRLPVYNAQTATTVVNRIINYELEPLLNTNVLSTGQTLTLPNVRDAETKGDVIFSIMNYYEYLTQTKFYNNIQNVNLPFNPNSLVQLYNQGYYYINLLTHGFPFGFEFETIFTSSMARSVTNPGHTIFTTMACLTNAFDKFENDNPALPCVSESFLCNPNSGLVAYLGPSRQGWYVSSPLENMSHSPGYQSLFHRALRQGPYPDKSIAAITNYEKYWFGGYEDPDKTWRWLALCNNPIGDPETPLYTTPANTFNQATAVISNGQLNIDTGVDDCTVCVTSTTDSNYFQVFLGRNITVPNPPAHAQVCVSKPSYNYIPKIVNVTYQHVHNNDVIVSCVPNPTTGPVTINYSLMTLAQTVDIIILDINGQTMMTIPADPFQNSVSADLSSLPAGNYYAILRVNGQPTGSQYHIIKS